MWKVQLIFYEESVSSLRAWWGNTQGTDVTQKELTNEKPSYSSVLHKFAS